MFDYTEKWGDILKPYKNKTKNYLEIGLYKGVTLPIWKNYFNCNVYGIDITLKNLTIDKKDFFIYEANSIDKEFANKMFNDVWFDVIVDDASPHLHVQTFEIYSQKLNKDGIYVIETFRQNPNFLETLAILKKNKDFNFRVVISRLSKKPVIVATPCPFS
jgi:hypothetical protein